MPENKTKETNASVQTFLNQIPEPQKRADAKAIIEIMKKVSGEKPKMWGTSMIGFGSRHYQYESGHSGDIFIIGFSPRKQNFALYIAPPGGYEKHGSTMKKLGKYKTGKGCLYINKMSDVDPEVLRKLMSKSFER